MKKLTVLAALVAAFYCGSALAATGTATITFTPPTTYTDGSPLPATAISGYAINCVFSPTGGGAATPCVISPTSFPGGGSTGGTLSITYPAIGGSACFSLQTQVGSALSAATTPVCKAFAAANPNPPTNVTVTVTLTLNLSSASPITVAAVSPVVTVH